MPVEILERELELTDVRLRIILKPLGYVADASIFVLGASVSHLS